MRKILSQIIAATAGLWIATLFMPEIIVRTYPQSNFFGFSLVYQWEIFLLLGAVLGLLNYFLRSLLKLFALPLQIITLGLFTIVINACLIWILDMMFDELSVPLFLPLLYISVIMWGLNIIVGLFFARGKK